MQPVVWTAAQHFAGGKRPSIDRPTLVMYHWNNCGHCKTLRPEWDRLPDAIRMDREWGMLATSNPSSFDLQFAEIEADELHTITQQYGKDYFTEMVYVGESPTGATQSRPLKGFPELRLYVPSMKSSQALGQGQPTPEVYLFKGARQADNIASWAKRILQARSGISAGASSGGGTPPLSVTYGYRRKPSRGSARRCAAGTVVSVWPTVREQVSLGRPPLLYHSPVKQTAVQSERRRSRRHSQSAAPPPTPLAAVVSFGQVSAAAAVAESPMSGRPRRRLSSTSSRRLHRKRRRDAEGSSSSSWRQYERSHRRQDDYCSSSTSSSCSSDYD